MDKKDGGSAFPQHGFSQNEKIREEMSRCGGMSLRDYFAGQAMIAISQVVIEKRVFRPVVGETYRPEMSVIQWPDESSTETEDCIANVAYRIADAMILARGA